ncbi:MAG TPA: VOC family protein [Solirubrobacteraceae bacterium]|jgi:predicted enzyme related to lactoylglutathione lyase|nr:VOC family protein [Solirubrobacteraceae bacterium]
MFGKPSHFEIGVPDLARAQKFYGRLLGWSFEETGGGARIATPGTVGGLHEDEPWIQIFYSVPDIDEAIRLVVELGGEVDEGASDGPGGRYVHSCRDDQGVPFGLHQPSEE